MAASLPGFREAAAGPGILGAGAAAASARSSGEFAVPIAKSQVLELDVPYDTAMVGNAAIADVMPLTDRSLYVLGKEIGSTSLSIYDKNRNLIAVLDLVITPDIEGLKKRLYELMPTEELSVRPANGSLLLSGSVSSAPRLAKAVAVAEAYAPGKVVNLMSVGAAQQVMLEVRFSEMQRTTSKQLGLNFGISDNDGDFVFQTGKVFLNNAITDAFGIGSGASLNLGGGGSLDILFDAMEDKGLVKVLAEPTLMAMSGDKASFLAGGEFPVPVAQDSGDGNLVITVQFREFGVGLGFTPTVLDDGLINLEVAPEVSAIDRSTSVQISGFQIPGLATRRASTTVELRDGESFAIAGLLQSDFSDTVSQFPVLGDIPVLGALFRSTRFQKEETELVIIVTPRLVRPSTLPLRGPTDYFVPPSEMELFALGRLASKNAPVDTNARAGVLLRQRPEAGLDGEFGHVIQ